MVFENIEQLKRDFTDKYVVVDANRAELRRFRYLTGIVKTVNMNGRALVEFNGNQNIGWYDIELDFLKVVDKPQDVAPAKTERDTSRPAAKAVAKAAAKSAAKPAPKTGGGGMSVADILAAARGGADAAAAAPQAASSKPAASQPSASKPASPQRAPADAKSMSVAEILAAARGQSAAASDSPPVNAEQPQPTTANTPTSGAAKSRDTRSSAPADPKSMSVEEILAAARGQAAPPPLRHPRPPRWNPSRRKRSPIPRQMIRRSPHQ